jgi:hypothetical protein
LVEDSIWNSGRCEQGTSEEEKEEEEEEEDGIT